MVEIKKMNQRAGEQGNVLFLILIAVALFAALSYAVTQSSRSGGGSANNETSLISSATVTQYPASIRTAIIRMMVSNNIAASELQFNAPSDFSACTSTARCVFHPSGGGATYAPSPADVVTTGSVQPWVFNGENQVWNVGTSATPPTSATVEIIALLPNVKDAICNKINTELGIGSTPTETGIDVTHALGTGANGGGITWVNGLAAGGAPGTIGDSSGSSLNGQAFGCFKQSSVNYYYHVLIEQ